MIVVDASALLDGLTREDRVGALVTARLAEDLEQHCPQNCKAEVLSGLRRLEALGEIPLERANVLSRRLIDMELNTYPIDGLIPRVWDLRQNMSVYDAWYVALAEAIDAPLVTTDGRLARATGARCEIELIA